MTFSSAGKPDFFTWARNGGGASSPIAITGAAQPIADGVTVTFASRTGHTVGGSCVIAASAHGSVGTLQFIHRFPGSVLRSAEARLRDSVSVTDFGADPTGAADSLPAFNAAKKAVASSAVGLAGSPGYIHVPLGVYNFASGFFSLDASNMHVVCDPGTEIRYTGTASIDSPMEVGNNAGNYANNNVHQGVSGCTIRGNSHVTGAAIHVSNSTSAIFSELNLKDAPIGFQLDWGNTVKLDHILVTQYNGLMTILPTTGILISHMNNVDIVDPSVEDLCSEPTGSRCVFGSWKNGTVTMQTATAHGLSTGSLVTVAAEGGANAGYDAVSVPVTVVDAFTFTYALAANPGQDFSAVLGAGTVKRMADGAVFAIGTRLPQSIGIKFESTLVAIIHGGTSEGNNYGVVIDGNSGSIALHGMDNEANPNGDLQSAGFGVHVFGGVYMYNIHIVGSGPGNKGQLTTIDGVATGEILIDSGVAGTTVINSTYGNTLLNGGNIDDNGTHTTLLNNRNANGGTFFSNKLYGIQVSGDLSSVGFGVSPVTNDPNGYPNAFATKSDYFLMAQGPRTFPTCGATFGHNGVWFDQGSPGASGAFYICAKDAADTWVWRPLWRDGLGVTINAGAGLTGGGLVTPGGSITLNAATAPAVNQVLFSNTDTAGASPVSANNALAMDMTDPLTGSPWVVTGGRPFLLGLQHTLQAGPNTLNLNGTGALPIFSPSGRNLTIGFAACCSVVIELIRSGAGYQLLSTQ